MEMKFFGTSIVIMALIAFGCGTPQPECINDLSKDMSISWGRYVFEEKKTLGYKLRSDAVLYSYGGKKIKELDPNHFCRMISLARRTLLNTQTLNEPADTAHFFIYKNPATNTSMRWLWNPHFKTLGSKQFRALYDSLQTLLPEERIE